MRPDPAWSDLPDVHPFLSQGLSQRIPDFLTRGEAFGQLDYVERYVRALGCGSVLIENAYIDRDFVDEYSVYYSRCLLPYTNVCRRIHFFRSDSRIASAALEAVLLEGASGRVKHFREACEEFAREHYLGFSVIRPLAGSPVGRTVLVPPTDSHFPMLLGGVRRYSAHLLGIELTVSGLAFQQQDAGVSACATTAIWAALHKYRDHEDTPTATPAQITAMACRLTLPASGRTMPSEGLNVEQMAQAITAYGVAPNVLHPKTKADALAYCGTALKSGFAPILVIRCPGDLGEHHAVTVVGAVESEKGTYECGPYIGMHLASRIGSLIIHDDRCGPYLKALVNQDTVVEEGPRHRGLVDTRLELSIPTTSGDHEAHTVEHIVVPMPPKIRLSFSDLRAIVLDALGKVQASQRLLMSEEPEIARKVDTALYYETWFQRSHKYTESLLTSGAEHSYACVSELARSISLPRYLGIIRARSGLFDPIDLLIDTTDTFRNVRCLAVVVPRAGLRLTGNVAADLAQAYRCALVPVGLVQPSQS